MNRFLLTIILINGIVINSFNQTDSSKFKIDFILRYRFEFWNGMNAKNYGDQSFVSIGSLNDKIILQRVIAGTTWHPQKNIEVAAHIQDSRAFGWSLSNSKYPDLFKIKKTGTEAPYYKMNPNEEFFEIYDAYIQYDKLFKNITAKLGRQKIFYGDNHIFGSGEWGNTGRWTWDALKFSYNKNNLSLDFFAGGTKIHDPQKISIPFIKTEFFGAGFYGHYNLRNQITIEPFFASKIQGTADYIRDNKINRKWMGSRFFNKDHNNYIYDITAVYEFGNENSKRIKAYAFFAKLGYQFHSIPLKPIISLQESYASGGDKTDDVIQNFDPVFGASDKYYGRMNIVTWSNIDDREIVLELFPTEKMWVEIKYNRFYIPYPKSLTILNTLKMKPEGKVLGNEFNIFTRYQAFKHLQFVVLWVFYP